MFQAVIILVGLTAFCAGSLSTVPQVSPKIVELRKGLKQCHNDVITYILTGNDTMTCKYKDDFANKIEEYVAAYRKQYNHTLHRNELYIKQLMYQFSHPYAREYYQSIKSGIYCFETGRSGKHNIATTTNVNVRDPLRTLLRNLFTPKADIILNEPTCERNEVTKQQLQTTESSSCSNNTVQVYIGLCDLIIDECKRLNIIHVQRTIPVVSNTWEFNSSTLLVVIIAGVIMAILVIIIITLIVVRQCCINTKDEKSADKLPDKKVMP